MPFPLLIPLLASKGAVVGRFVYRDRLRARVAHHGDEDNADPAIYAAIEPRVAVENNGLKKGGSRETYELLHHVAALEDVWQLHRSQKAGDANFAAKRIANPDESTAYWIKLSANEDGSFRVLNGRTGEWKSYPSRYKDKRQ